MKSNMGLFKTFAIAFYALSAASLAAGPIATIEGPASADFGRYPAKEEKIAAFCIVNKGDTPLKILGVRNVCDCVEAKIQEQELPPGGKFTFNAKILPDSIYGQYSKPVYIRTDDPANKFLSIKLSGDAVPILKTVLEPEIYAGRIKLGSPWVKDIDLETTEDGVEPGNPTADCLLPAKASVEKLSSRAFRLKLEIAPQENQIGPFHCKLKVPVSKPGGWKPVNIDVSGFAGAELVAVPSKILLPADSSTPLELSLELHLIDPSARLLKGEDISFVQPKGIAIAISQKAPGVVAAKVNIPAGFAIVAGNAIEFRTEGAKPLSIPIASRRAEPAATP